jgi:flagellar protein FliS
MQQLQTIYVLGKADGARNQYKEQSILTANPGDLVMMLYDGALKNVRLARTAIREDEIGLSNRHNQKAQDIIDELIKGLDFSYDISYDLIKLYDFIMQELIEANISKDQGKLSNAEDLIADLKSTWEEVVKQCRVQAMQMTR